MQPLLRSTPDLARFVNQGQRLAQLVLPDQVRHAEMR